MSARNGRLPALLLLLDLTLVFGWPLLDPFVPGAALAAAAALVVALNLAALRSASWRARFDRLWRRGEALQRAALVVASLAVTGGGLELLADGLTAVGLVEPYSAMRTMLPGGVEDWRLAHLTADRHRQPDPELLWRPVARPPYNRQRFKGPELADETPAASRRVFCYGDSNTDGPDTGGWPGQLGELVARRGAVVINAGVAGYSSHQGLLRLGRDAPRYRPDVVLVSFGWNDAAPALGAPDREFRPPPLPLVAVQRLMLHYRFFLVARRYWPRRQEAAAIGPRVTLADYRANLEGFLDTATAYGARVAFLTRPHREPPEALAALSDNWRRRVPEYNEVLRRFTEERDQTLIDVQSRFAGRRRLFIDECHFTPTGHQRMAAFVARRLRQAGLLAPPSEPGAV